MAADQFPFFFDARRRQLFAGGEVMFHLVENPRGAHGGAADHGAGNTGFGAAPDHVGSTR